MKYYVTFKKTQLVTFMVEAANKTEARNLGASMAASDEAPYDILDTGIKGTTCISHREFLLYK